MKSSMVVKDALELYVSRFSQVKDSLDNLTAIFNKKRDDLYEKEFSLYKDFLSQLEKVNQAKFENRLIKLQFSTEKHCRKKEGLFFDTKEYYEVQRVKELKLQDKIALGEEFNIDLSNFKENSDVYTSFHHHGQAVISQYLFTLNQEHVEHGRFIKYSYKSEVLELIPSREERLAEKLYEELNVVVVKLRSLPSNIVVELSDHELGLLPQPQVVALPRVNTK